MTNEIKGGGTHELSTDINVITAEINAYQRVAGEAIFEIGKRLKGVRDKPEDYGFKDYRDWEAWCNTELEISRQYANQFIKVFEELGNSGFRKLGIKALYQIATMPEKSRTESHTLKSGTTKTVDEMTVKELREVKEELKRVQAEKKQAEASAKQAQRSESIATSRLEEFEGREPTVEIRTEYVEVVKRDETIERKVERYEELFGDVSMYEGKTTRVTNGDAVTYAVYEFSEDVRRFTEKYAHLTHFAREFSGMIDEGKAEYINAISSMQSLMNGINRMIDTNEGKIING